MKRYYFDAEDGPSSHDDRGTEIPNMDGVRRAAVRMLGQMLSDSSASFWSDPELRLTVRDDTDLILLRLTVFGMLAPACR